MVYREAALFAAATAPQFFRRDTQPQKTPKYPFVFDSYAEAKQSSAFVAGAKVSCYELISEFVI